MRPRPCCTPHGLIRPILSFSLTCRPHPESCFRLSYHLRAREGNSFIVLHIVQHGPCYKVVSFIIFVNTRSSFPGMRSFIHFASFALRGIIASLFRRAAARMIICAHRSADMTRRSRRVVDPAFRVKGLLAYRSGDKTGVDHRHADPE